MNAHYVLPRTSDTPNGWRWLAGYGAFLFVFVFFAVDCFYGAILALDFLSHP